MHLDALIKTLSALHRAFRRAFRRPASAVVGAGCAVPLLGEHTASYGGATLALAGDHYLYLAGRPRADERLQVHHVNQGHTVQFTLDRAGPAWTQPLVALAMACRNAGYTVCGVDAAFILPTGWTTEDRGWEISLAVAMVWLWREVKEWSTSAVDLARQLSGDVSLPPPRREEIRVLLLGRQGQVTYVEDYAHHQSWYPWPRSISVVLADVRAATAPSEAERERQEQTLATALQSLRTLADIDTPLARMTPDMLTAVRQRLKASEGFLLEHLLSEQERVQWALRACVADDPAALGAVLNESHISARDVLNVVPSEVDALWQALNAAPGCYGARAAWYFAPGRVVALFSPRTVKEALTQVSEQVRQEHHLMAALRVVEPADGVLSL